MARAGGVAAQTQSVVVPDDDEDPAMAQAPLVQETKPVRGVPVGMPKTVRIILEETENMGPTGQMFSVNGRAYLIRPGEPVDIPPEVLEVIDNAILSVPVIDQATRRVIGQRDRHRFPYRRVSARD